MGLLTVLMIIQLVVCGAFAQNASDSKTQDLLTAISQLNARVENMQMRLAENKLRIEKDFKESTETITRETEFLKKQYTYQLESIPQELNQQRQEIDLTPTPYSFSDFGCYLQTLSLGCPLGQTISVTSAYYGQYYFTCSDTCCAPHPTRDCVESLEEHAPQDWVAIKYACDFEQTCQFLNQGGLVSSCLAPYDSQYLMVYYTCTPEYPPSRVAVGFTAFPAVTRTYNNGELILFKIATSNMDSGYNTDSSTFICPVDGIYVFSATLASTADYTVRGDIMLERTVLTSIIADDDDVNQGTSVVVVNCAKNERVFVQCSADSSNISGGRVTSFSGFLAIPYVD